MKKLIGVLTGAWVIWTFLFQFQLYAQPIQRAENRVGELRIAFFNNGTLGKPDARNNQNGHVSMQYPLGSGTEHLFEAGIWLGAIVNGEIRVSTSSVTSPGGYRAGSAGFEFTPAGIIREEGRQDGSISDSDYIVEFTDRNTSVNNTPIEGHESPLGADVQMRVLSWFEEQHSNFVILEYTITNNSSAAWEEMYFGQMADIVVRNVLTTQEAGSAFFNKGGHGYIDSLYTIYSFDAGSPDNPSVNTYGAFSILGSRIGDTFSHPLNSEYLNDQGLPVPQVNPSFWAFSEGTGSFANPADDIERYNRMANLFPYEEVAEKLRTDGQNGNGNYISLISIGPYAQVEPGESLTVYVGASAALKPEDYQGPSGKPVDNETTRAPLVQTIQRELALVKGEDIQNWDDNFEIAGYSGAYLYFSGLLDRHTLEAANFQWKISGPEPELASTHTISLNGGAEQALPVGSRNEVLVFNDSLENGEKVAFAETDLDRVRLDNKLEEGGNTISISAYDSEGSFLDSVAHEWGVQTKKHDILVIQDYRERPESFSSSPFFNGLEYDSLNFRDFSYLYYQTLQEGVTEELKSSVSRWKGVIWMDEYSGASHIRHAPEIFSRLLEKGGKALFYVPEFAIPDSETLQSFLDISEKRSTEGIELSFYSQSGNPVIPFQNEYGLDTLTISGNLILSGSLYRPDSDTDSLYGVSFQSRTVTGSLNDLGVYPVAWYNEEKGTAFMYLGLDSIEDPEKAKEVVNILANEVLDIPSVVLTGNEENRSGDIHPESVSFQQNYPNPFNPNTSIQFSLQHGEQVSLIVYDILGRKVATLVDASKPAGSYTVNFDASNLSSGIYMYRLKAGDFIETRKMTLIK